MRVDHERRRRERFNIALPITIKTPLGTARGQTRALSGSGPSSAAEGESRSRELRLRADWTGFLRLLRQDEPAPPYPPIGRRHE
jgi:hypothetical protein